MKVKQVVPPLAENSALPPGVNQDTGLSRNDPFANIDMITDEIFEIMQNMDKAIEQMVATAKKDPWGTQSSLLNIKKNLIDILQFANGTAE